MSHLLVDSNTNWPSEQQIIRGTDSGTSSLRAKSVLKKALCSALLFLQKN